MALYSAELKGAKMVGMSAAWKVASKADLMAEKMVDSKDTTKELQWAGS